MMKSFNEIQFDIPNEYILADKKTINELLDNRIGEIDHSFLVTLSEVFNSQNMVMLYDPSKYDAEIGTAREYINFGRTENRCPFEKNPENKDIIKKYLDEQKIIEKNMFQQAYGSKLEFYKYEISRIPSHSIFSTYTETNGAVEETCNFQYTFWMSENIQFVATLQCFEKEKNESTQVFKEIVQSVIKN